MEITYKNIIADYNYQEEEFNGACYFDFSTEVLNKFLQENEGAEFTQNLASELEEAKDGEYLTETHQIYDTDLGIYIFYWMLYECPKENFIFEYYGESPFWLFHDLSHAENDINGGVLYVDQWIEEKRIFDGLKLLKKANMMEEFKPSMFESIVNDFRQRWKHEIDTKRILKKMGWKKRDFFELLECY
jgi:hypothetical protein